LARSGSRSTIRAIVGYSASVAALALVVRGSPCATSGHCRHSPNGEVMPAKIQSEICAVAVHAIRGTEIKKGARFELAASGFSQRAPRFDVISRHDSRGPAGPETETQNRS